MGEEGETREIGERYLSLFFSLSLCVCLSITLFLSRSQQCSRFRRRRCYCCFCSSSIIVRWDDDIFEPFGTRVAFRGEREREKKRSLPEFFLFFLCLFQFNQSIQFLFSDRSKETQLLRSLSQFVDSFSSSLSLFRSLSRSRARPLVRSLWTTSYCIDHQYGPPMSPKSDCSFRHRPAEVRHSIDTESMCD